PSDRDPISRAGPERSHRPDPRTRRTCGSLSWCHSSLGPAQARSDLLGIEMDRVQHALDGNSPADIRFRDDPRQAELVAALAKPVAHFARRAVRDPRAPHVVVGYARETFLA